MKTKVLIPLVILTSIILVVSSITIYFYTREEKTNFEGGSQEKVENEIDDIESPNIYTNEEQKVDSDKEIFDDTNNNKKDLENNNEEKPNVDKSTSSQNTNSSSSSNSKTQSSNKTQNSSSESNSSSNSSSSNTSSGEPKEETTKPKEEIPKKDDYKSTDEYKKFVKEHPFSTGDACEEKGLELRIADEEIRNTMCLLEGFNSEVSGYALVIFLPFW